MLIAKDDFTSRTVFAGMLKLEGHEVTVMVNGAETWQALKLPDALAPVILNWMMPISQHSDARFSHCIGPEFLTQHDPDFFQYPDDGGGKRTPR